MYGYYGLVFLLFVAIWYFKTRSKSSRNPLPPGPKPIPFIGNIYDIPRVASWRVFQDWGKKYGDFSKLLYIVAGGLNLHLR